MAKKKEIDFDKELKSIEEKVEQLNLKQDDVVQTMIAEYKRMKYVCDKLFEEIEDKPIAYSEEGSTGRMTYKSNPVIKDYVNASSKLVTICSAIKETLTKHELEENNDWL